MQRTNVYTCRVIHPSLFASLVATLAFYGQLEHEMVRRVLAFLLAKYVQTLANSARYEYTLCYLCDCSPCYSNRKMRHG
jgi:hypothetical protein